MFKFKIGDWVRVSMDGVRIVEVMIKDICNDRFLVETSNGYQKWIKKNRIVGSL